MTAQLSDTSPDLVQITEAQFDAAVKGFGFLGAVSMEVKDTDSETQLKTCPSCRGTGDQPHVSHGMPCERCEGLGVIPNPTSAERYLVDQREYEKIIQQGTLKEIEHFHQVNFHKIKHSASFMLLLKRLRRAETIISELENVLACKTKIHT